ncbi:uncharacterized protein VNE69_06011 [Vairimorpha necatrix]|uniref:Uncharacterized protein n=1 Tax=Vairimorpha necatrix TaxID=6039 RepID=A0AAX4JCH2_9MICR
MLRRIFLNFFCAYCELTLFINIKQNYYCDAYIGVYDDSHFPCNCKIFLSKGAGLLYNKIYAQNDLKNIIDSVLNDGLSLKQVDKNEHERIKSITHLITDDEIRINFLKSEFFYKCSFSLIEYRNFFFEIIFYNEKKSTISWASTKLFQFKKNIVYSKLDLYCEKSLSIKASDLYIFIDSLKLKSESDVFKLNY